MSDRKWKKGPPQLSIEARAALTYNALDLLGRDMIAVLLIFMYFSEEIIAKVPWLQKERKKVGDGPFAGVQQIALSALASTMMKYCEVYRRYLKGCGITHSDAKTLFKDAQRFYELRQATQHIDDTSTGLTNTATRTVRALMKISSLQPPVLSKEGIASLGTRIIATRDAVNTQFPSAKTGRTDYLAEAIGALGELVSQGNQRE